MRRYQSLEVALNKNFSRGFLIRANYRFAKLWGNYEGLFRNDNGQSDPGISSLFDFTQGVIGLLGTQFQPGYLNTDRRNVGNLYGSYTLPNWIIPQADAVALDCVARVVRRSRNWHRTPCTRTRVRFPSVAAVFLVRTATTLQLDTSPRLSHKLR